MFDLLSLVLFCCLGTIGYVAGRFTEQRHYRSIRTRERELADVLVFASRFPVLPHADNQVLVAGSVVIAEDYFKRIVSGLQSLSRRPPEVLRVARRPCQARGGPAYEARGTRPRRTHDLQREVPDLRHPEQPQGQRRGRGSAGLWNRADPAYLTGMRAVEYSNPPLPEGVNVSPMHPLLDFARLAAALLAICVIAVVMLALLAERLAARVPFGMEQALAARFSDQLPPPNDISRYLQGLADRMTAADRLPPGMKITVHFVDEPTVNAFATWGDT